MDSKPTPKHVFLSYSHADAQMMSRIRDELESMGIRVWTDEGLTPGTESWKTTIEANIRDALGIIVILSPSANQSLWVERELEYANVHGIRIFPVLVQGEPGEAIPIELINAQWIDVRDEASFPSQIQKLVRALLAKPGVSRAVPERPSPRYPKTQSKRSKSTKNLIILFSVIIGVCLVCATTLTILFGPTIIASIRNDRATVTKVVLASTPRAPTDLPPASNPPPSVATTEMVTPPIDFSGTTQARAAEETAQASAEKETAQAIALAETAQAKAAEETAHAKATEDAAIGNYVVGIAIAGSNDYVFAWYKDGTGSTGTSSDLDGYQSSYAYLLPPGKSYGDIIDIGITGSDDHVFVWYKDGTVSSGTSWDFDEYRTPYAYSLPPGKSYGDIVGIGIAGSDDHVYAWYKDGTVSSGTSWDFDEYRAPYAYSLPPGKSYGDIVGIGIAGSNDHVYIWYKDGTVSSGTTRDFDEYRAPYPYSLH